VDGPGVLGANGGGLSAIRSIAARRIVAVPQLTARQVRGIAGHEKAWSLGPTHRWDYGHEESPAHALRHLLEDRARRAEFHGPLRMHLNPVNESEGYHRGLQFVPDTATPWVEKMAYPMTYKI